MTPLPTRQSVATDTPAVDPIFGLMPPAEPAAGDQDFDKVFREAAGETEAAEQEKAAEEKTESKANDEAARQKKPCQGFGGAGSFIPFAGGLRDPSQSQGEYDRQKPPSPKGNKLPPTKRPMLLKR